MYANDSSFSIQVQAYFAGFTMESLSSANKWIHANRDKFLGDFLRIRADDNGYIVVSKIRLVS